MPGTIQRAAILGAGGAIGHSAGAELLRREIPFRAIGRDGKKLEGAFAGQAEIRAADINDSDQTARAFKGCDTVVYAVGLPYPEHGLPPF